MSAARRNRDRSRTAAVETTDPGRDEAPGSAWRQMAIVFGVALAVRGLHYWFMRDALVYQVLISDARQYDQWARTIAGGEWMGTEVFYQTPLYPYFVGVLYSLFGTSVWVVRLAQGLLGAVACVCAARAGTHFFSPRAGWVAGLVLAVYPPAIFFDGIIQKASLDLVLMAALLWAVGITQQALKPTRVALVGAIMGAFILNRENAVLLVPLLLGWVGWLTWDRPWAARCLQGGTLLAGMAMVLLPVGLRNQYVGGEFLLTTSQMGPNFFIGNHARATGLYEPLRASRGDARFEREDARILAELDLGRSLSPSEISQYWMQRSLADIKADFPRWVGLLGRKWLMTWNEHEVVDGENLGAHADDSPLLRGLDWVLNFGVLCVAGVMGVCWTWRDWRRLWVLYGMALLFALAVTLFFVFGRYRYPLVPIVLLFAAAGSVELWDRVRSASWHDRLGELLLGVGLAVPTAIVCFWPIPSVDGDAVTYFNIGASLLENGRPAEAEVALRKSSLLNPAFAETYNIMGRAAKELGELERAERHFRRAATLDPSSAMAQYYLGMVSENRGDVDEAVRYYQAAAERDPLLATFPLAIARAELARHREAEAIPSLERSLELDPSNADVQAALAIALTTVGRPLEAIETYRRALEIDPNKRAAANNLAWLLATHPDDQVRDGAEAVRLATSICEQTEYRSPEMLDTLAAAHAEVGQFEQAAKAIERALALAIESDRQDLIESLRERLELVKQGQPIRE